MTDPMPDPHEAESRVAVFVPTDAELATALSILDSTGDRALRRYRGVLTVWCSAEELDALRGTRLTIDVMRPPMAVLRDAPPVQRLARPSSVSEDDPLLDGVRERADQQAVRFPESTDDMCLVLMRGPLDTERRAYLAEHHMVVTEYEPPNGYRMYLSPDQRAALTEQWWVKEIRPWGLNRSITPALAAVFGESGPSLLGDAGSAPDEYDVLLHRSEDLEFVRDAIAATDGTEILLALDVMIRFRTGLTGDALADLLAAIARLHEVRTLSPYRAPTLYVDHARALLGLCTLNADSPAPGRYTGEGQLVAIFDSGVDATHPDLADRIAVKNALVGSGPDDMIGHGTHVAGIIAGTGRASNGAITGCAPGATLAVYRVTDDDGRVQVPPCIGLFLRHAAEAGAKVINLSWGNALSGAYDAYSLSLDKFAHEHPDILVVVAAGNDGRAPEGHHLFNTIGTPATSKSALTVGACDTDRSDFADRTWKVLRASRFPVAPAGDERAAGSADLPAAISSRGPTDHDSVKPDLLAPGTFILSTRLRGTPIDHRLVWADCPEYDGHYVYIGGTSMAAPAVAGAAAVLRQYLAEEHDWPSPSAALLKAILVAGTRQVPALRDAGTWEDVGYPDFDQGFGRLDLSTILPCGDAPADRRITFRDIANDSPEALEAFAPADGERRASRAYRLTVTGSADPLRVVLAWTDHPGNAVQNNLNLGVIDPSGATMVGNARHTYQKGASGFDLQPPGPYARLVLDRSNTVELVAVEAPAPGEYRIQVLAQRTTFPPQGYAVVACGQLGSSLDAEP